MDEKDGLILGIDLQEETAQVCFYNDKLNIHRLHQEKMDRL